MISSPALAEKPGFSTTTTFTVSPRRASGEAMMQHSLIAGCLYIAASTSAGQTFMPAALIMRLRRSEMKK